MLPENFATHPYNNCELKIKNVETLMSSKTKQPGISKEHPDSLIVYSLYLIVIYKGSTHVFLNQLENEIVLNNPVCPLQTSP